jgi:ATP phosphoribosyltransferase
MESGVFALLADAGIRLGASSRDYRPHISLDGYDVKILKPQNIVEMLHVGSRDLGFVGADWVAELDAELTELLDTAMDPVRLVAAVPVGMVVDAPRERPLIVASEYERLTTSWIARRNLAARFVRSYGATEVFPPEDADCIVDNTATGATLKANGLEIVDELMTSSTRLYAHPRALDDGARRGAIERFVLVVRAVLEARRRVMVEVNVTAETLEAVVAVLPCMREPTISPLHGDAGFAVKAAVPRDLLPTVIPEIRARGGTDIVVTNLSQIVP